jgi:hypothetical protein
MTAASFDDEYGPTETESIDSVLVEFTDAEIDFTRRPVQDVVLRHAPSWLRERAPVHADSALAICLFDQARLHIQAKRFAEARTPLAEAQQILESAGDFVALADCCHLLSQVHEGLGDSEQALTALRREEELRRRLAA